MVVLLSFYKFDGLLQVERVLQDEVEGVDRLGDLVVELVVTLLDGLWLHVDLLVDLLVSLDREQHPLQLGHVQLEDVGQLLASPASDHPVLVAQPTTRGPLLDFKKHHVLVVLLERRVQEQLGALKVLDSFGSVALEDLVEGEEDLFVEPLREVVLEADVLELVPGDDERLRSHIVVVLVVVVEEFVKRHALLEHTAEQECLLDDLVVEVQVVWQDGLALLELREFVHVRVRVALADEVLEHHFVLVVHAGHQVHQQVLALAEAAQPELAQREHTQHPVLGQLQVP